MQLECNGQVCESYREREQASSSGVRRDDLGVFARVFGIAAPASGSVLCMCIMVVVVRVRVLQRVQTGDWPHQQTSSYMYAHREAPRSRRGRERERRGVGDAEHVPRSGEGLESEDPGREVDDARSRDIFHLHTTKPNTLSSGSADPRHQRLRRAASL